MPLAAAPTDAPAVSVATLRRLCLAMVSLGVLWRLARYALQFPIWGDEAFVCLNLLDRDYAALTGPLKCGQIAPLLFLWGELASYQLFGSSEYALRLLPLLAGLAALPLFWRLAWRTLPPLAATFAVAVLSVSYWPVVMCGTVKPYSLDLFMALLFLNLAVEWLHDPTRWIWLALLTALCPIALCASFPAVFVAGAVSLALLPTVWRRLDWTTGSLYAAFNVSMVGAFLFHFLVVGMNQLRGADGHVDMHYRDYWANGFPPGDPWEFGKWFVLIHTGRMFAYPIGAAEGGSTASAFLVLIGLIAYWRLPAERGRLILLLAPFALNFVAAVLAKYPYGGCCRLSQHLAPTSCLFIGLGIATLIERLAFLTPWRYTGVAFTALLLTAVMIGGLARDMYRPYKSIENMEMRSELQEIFGRVGPNDRVVVLNDVNDVDPMSSWWVARFGGDRVEWGRSWDRSPAGERVWTIEFYYGNAPTSAGQANLPPPPSNPADAAHIGQYGIMQRQVACWTRQSGAWVRSNGSY